MYSGGDVLYLPDTSLYIQINLPSIFISKIMCVPTYLNPGLNFPSLVLYGVTPFETSKATQMLSI